MCHNKPKPNGLQMDNDISDSTADSQLPYAHSPVVQDELGCKSSKVFTFTKTAKVFTIQYRYPTISVVDNCM